MESSITSKGQITLPAPMRKRFGMGQGQRVMFAATKDGILVKPAGIVDQTKRKAWRKALDESLAQADAGKGRFFASGEEFMDFLREEQKRADNKWKAREKKRKNA